MASQIRVGVHSGPVTACVIGDKNPKCLHTSTPHPFPIPARHALLA